MNFLRKKKKIPHTLFQKYSSSAVFLKKKARSLLIPFATFHAISYPFWLIFDRNFGLVLFYDKDKHNYTMAELLIEFEESEPFKGKMTVYIFSDDTRLLINRYQSFFTDFKFEFIGVKDNGLQHYKLGDWNFMLTQAQAQKLCGLYSQMEEK